jgi:hypothetical protein
MDESITRAAGAVHGQESFDAAPLAAKVNTKLRRKGEAWGHIEPTGA